MSLESETRELIAAWPEYEEEIMEWRHEGKSADEIMAILEEMNGDDDEEGCDEDEEYEDEGYDDDYDEETPGGTL